MGSKTQKATTTTSPPSDVLSAYQSLMSRAQGVANTPYQAYGQTYSPLQSQAFQGFSNDQQYLPQAQSMINAGASPITGQQIQSYENPFQNQVINATMGNIQETNAQQHANLIGNALPAGGLNNDRLGVAEGELARQQSLASNQTFAGLNAQNYQQGLAAAQADRAAQAQGGYQELGLSNANAGLLGAQLGAGATQYGQPYAQFQQQQAFPYQQTGWLAGLETGVGSQEGGTSQTTMPGPNPIAQWGGLGLAGLGIAGNLGWKPFAARGGRIRGYAMGGSPFQADPSPYGGQGFIPGLAIRQGPGAPRPPQIPQQSGASNMINNALGLAKQMKSGSTGQDYGSIPNSNAWNVGGESLENTGLGGIPFIPGDTSGSISNPNAWGGISGLYESQGGAVQPSLIPQGYDDGGKVADDDMQQPYFNIPSRDFSKEPASVGEQALTTAKMVAEPWARTIRHISRGVAQHFDDGGSVGRIYSENEPSPLDPPSGYDRDQAIRTIYGEGSQSPEERLAIANVIRNRAVDSGDGIPGIVHAKNQFEAWDRPEAIARMNSLSPDDPQYQQISQLVDKAYAGNDPTNGARNFYSPGAQAALGRQPPSWAQGDGQQIGQQAFYGGNGGIPSTGDEEELEPGTMPAEAPGIPATPQVSDDSGKPAPWAIPLIAAGFGMMASRSPFLGTAIGEGGMQGLNAYAGQQQEAMKQRNIDLQAKRLDQQATQAQKHLEIQTQQLAETKRQHDATMMQPVTIGQNILGDIKAIKDPTTGQFRIIDPKTGRVGPVVDPSAIPPQSATEQPGNESALPPQATPVEGGRNEEFLNKLKADDPGTATLVKSIADYDTPPTYLSIKGGHREKILGLVTQYDPSYSAPFYSSRAAAIKEFNAGGINSPAGMITAGNTAIQHLARLSDVSEKIGGTSNYSVLNSPINWANATAKQLANDPDLTRYKQIEGRFSEEATKFYRGIGGTESDIRRAIDAVTAAQSPEARRAAISEQAELMQSKINALQDRYKTAMGGPIGWQTLIKKSNMPDFPIVQQHSAEGLEKIRARAEGKKVDEATPAPPKSDNVKLSAPDRFKQLIDSGASKEDAYAKMHQEGY